MSTSTTANKHRRAKAPPVATAAGTPIVAPPVVEQGQNMKKKKKQKAATTAVTPPAVVNMKPKALVPTVAKPAATVQQTIPTVVAPQSTLPTPSSSPAVTRSPLRDENVAQGKGKSFVQPILHHSYPSPSGTPPAEERAPSATPSQRGDENDFDQAEFQLLDNGPIGGTDSFDHERRTAPLFTRDAKGPAGFCKHRSQYAVLGSLLAIRDKDRVENPEDPRIYVNTNAPFSAVVCGVQGSGKSHTVSVLLENMLVPGCRQIGTLEKPLSGLVLHFGPGGDTSLPCEAAWLGRAKFQGLRVPPVRVYVSRSALGTMRRVYAPLGDNVTVEPLMFTEAELDAEAFLSMMAVDSSESAPLYMQVILSILRDLGENYTYQAFLEILEEQKKSFSPIQKSHLDQRMALLKTFTSTAIRERPRFAAGQLTIVDLTDPFIDPKSACGLFEIVTRLFVRAEVGTGKVLVVDEAHKYLSASAGLTEALLSLSRQMRHYGMRVIISSQEPTVVPPVLLDLCSVAFLHRFSSQSWWNHVAKHFSADLSTDGAFDEVVKLKTGQAIVLAPSSLAMLRQPGAPGLQLGQLGRRYMLVKTRTRITKDGGASILVL